MKREPVDGGDERKIVTGLIVSDEFARRFLPLYRPELFETSVGQTVAAWAVAFVEQYGKAPGRHVQDLFAAAEQRGELNEETGGLVREFLLQLSEDWEKTDGLNVAYLLDRAEALMRRRALRAMAEGALADLREGVEPVEVEARVANFRAPARPTSQGINPFTDEEAIYGAFEEEYEPLFTFPGALGELLNPQLAREGFVALMGPEKRGKTWWLMEMAFRALKARCNVAFFGAGDMNLRQMTRRFHIRLVGRSNHRRYCHRLLIPVPDCKYAQDGDCPLNRPGPNLQDGAGGTLPYDRRPAGYQPCTRCVTENPQQYDGRVWYEERPRVEPLSWREGLKAGKQFMASVARGRDFRLVSYPTTTLTLDEIRAQLDLWERLEGFVPDVLVVDYADILAAPDLRKDPRHQENDKWIGLRCLSQERHVLVLTATQTDADSYRRVTLSMDNFSEDKRKYGHVTAMFTLNQTEEEKAAGVMRVAELLAREDEALASRTVTVLQSLATGRPCLGSFW